jgi:DNA-binding MarR family transcriptional regulator
MEADEVIHQSTRLRIMATLRGMPLGEMLDFPRLKAILATTDGNLGTHLAALEKAGYVAVTKDYVGKKPRTRIEMTKSGARAFEAHVAYLRNLIDP